MSGSKANMTSPDIIWLTDDILFMTYFGELYIPSPPRKTRLPPSGYLRRASV